MTTRRALLASAVFALTCATPLAAEDAKTKVVATFSILGDMVARVGGDHITLTTLVGPEGDTHVYRPTPAAAKAVGEADVLIVNGLEFEGWLDRLAESAGFEETKVVATAGIAAIAYGEDEHGDHDDHSGHDDHAEHEDHADDAKHEEHADHDEHAEHDDHDEHAGHEGHDHGAFDPHAWQSLVHAVTYVDNITEALAKADPSNASAFYENRAAYVAELTALDAEIRDLVANLPADKRTVVTSHDAFQYFGQAYGLTFLAPQGLSTESEASAKDVAHLIEQMREEGIDAVFIENITDPRLIKQIANETGASVGGTLYPGALSAKDGPASTYLDMMRHNALTLTQALNS